MSVLFKELANDEEKEINGIEVKPVGANENGSFPTFIVSRAVERNQRWAKAVTTEVHPYRRLIAADALDAKTATHINMTVFCKSQLMGWSNVFNQKDELLPFNFENAMSLMQQLPDLYAILSAASNNAALFGANAKESDAKNS